MEARGTLRRFVRQAGLCDWLLPVAVFLLCSLSGIMAANTAANSVAKVYFKAFCKVHHRLKDDPIFFPGKPGASHMHDFFGSTVVNAFTNSTRQLQAGSTSCQPPGAKSGYWIPTMYRLNPITKRYYAEPARVLTVYYFNRYHGDLRKTVKPYPQGLRMICGNPSAGPYDTPKHIVEWFCQEQAAMGNRTKYNNIPPKCKGLIIARIFCPSCWDGRRRDSPNHRSHMEYINNVTTECPHTHPVRLPEIHITITYNFSGAVWPEGGVRNTKNPPSARLSTKDGGGWQLHADVWEAWDQKTLDNFMEKCFYAGITCGPDAKNDAQPPPPKRSTRFPPPPKKPPKL